MEFDVKKTNMVKCIAIILMLIHHLFYCAPELCGEYGTESMVFSWNDIMSFSSACKVCVGIFVFLTAYGITKTYHIEFTENGIDCSSAIGKFCMKRYIKLELNFLFIYVLTVLTYFLRGGGQTSVQQIYGSNGWKYGIMYALTDMFGFEFLFSFSAPTLNSTWWYMSTAILLVFLIPVLVKLYKRFGVSIIVCIIFLFYGKEYDGVSEYALCMMTGIFCAENRILEKMHEKRIFGQDCLNSWFKMLIYIFIAACLLNIRIKVDMHFFVDAVMPVICSGFCMEFALLCSLGERIMAFIGSYSMNMFLIHTLIFLYYFPKFVYWSKNWTVVLMVLTVTSLILSILIEKIKQVIGYKKLIDKVIRCLD